MTTYNPGTLTPQSSRNLIDDAYKTAGLPVPNRVDAVSELLREEPTAYDVAVKYANKSINGEGDAKDLLEQAIAEVIRAQAVDSFRDVYENTVDAIALTRIDVLRDQAVKDLTRAFNKTVRALADAAEKLDAKTPLDKERAFEQDTSEAYKAAIAALHTLAAYSFNAPGYIDRSNGQTTRILAIVDIPEVSTPQRVHAGGITDIVRKVPDDLTPTRSILRNMIRDAERDIDTALVRIARGEYKGVKLDLANTAEIAKRATSLGNALTDVRASTD